MEPPYEAIVFLAILSIFAAILSIRQARRKGDKIHYIGALVGCLMLTILVLALLNQALFAFILLVVGGIACIATLPSVMNIQKRKIDEQLAKATKETNLSEPLRLREILTWNGWLKLAYKWGVWKTATIYSLLGAFVIAGVSYTALSLFNTMNVWLVTGYTVSTTIVIFILFHRQLSEAIKESELYKS